MSTGELIKAGLIVTGIVIMVFSFVLHALRRLTVNLAVMWEFMGVVLILIGAIPALSAWCYLVGWGSAISLFFVGVLTVWQGYQLSILISSLYMKNQELAMQVSLLNQENEKILKELTKITGKSRQDL